MTERTIDLRNQETRARPVMQQDAPSDHGEDLNRKTRTHPEKKSAVSPAKPLPDKKYLLQWKAFEYPFQERGPYWFLLPFGVALLFVIFGILIKSWFFIAFVALALGVILLYARRPPREYRFAVAKEGILVGGTLHRYSELKSFWIFDTSGESELSLETSKLLHPYLRMPLGEVHPNKVRSVLSDFLPEQEHKEFFTDQIARSIGF